MPKDLSKFDAAEEIYEEIQRQNISVDYLINNARLRKTWKRQNLIEAMLRGDMEVISKLTAEQVEWFKTIPTTPKEILLKQLFEMQR